MRDAIVHQDVLIVENETALELVTEPFPPQLVDEDCTLALYYFGSNFADILQHVRSNNLLSPVIYTCSFTFMISGCVLFAVKSMLSVPMLERILSVVMYCTSGFAFWQSAQSTMRLLHPLMILLVQSFDCWYKKHHVQNFHELNMNQLVYVLFIYKFRYIFIDRIYYCHVDGW